jgi:hypothetical protein
MYLWRAVDHEGEVLDMLVQHRRDTRAALRLMRKLLKKQGFAPKLLVTDKLRSYAAAFRRLRLTCPHEHRVAEPYTAPFAPLLAADFCGGRSLREGSRSSDVGIVGILTFAIPGDHMWTPRRLMGRRDKRASAHSPPG